MECPHCQTINREDAEFCKECGRSLQDEFICPQCGYLNTNDSKFCNKCGSSLLKQTPSPMETKADEPTSFVDNRFQVISKLGEGGKKKVYLVHDTKLDRDVAFALIKTENLNESARIRVTREAQTMGKLGDHPNIMPIHEMGEINGQPYLVMPHMPGINGNKDVEALIEKSPDHKLPLDQVISIAKCVCRGLEFAHSKGAIHRDIKPGNVWLAEDGTAKIGDFGLAVMTDVSRLTQEGIMVGTPNYLSPEQAGPGEVTHKSDLYSLGAMLYEMVTGRPPFIGDDSYSIIGQHITTPPISPSWHRDDLPPAFEALIMMLLDKDPSKRPSSAQEVHKALESIEKDDMKESTAERPVETENPLYRPVFVGREQELKQLQSAFNGAMSGQGALVMVVGEPGIGKTAICEHLSTFVNLRGGRTLWGHCYEEGSLTLPYLAFIEAMRSYVHDRDPEELKKELGSGATHVARIVSEVREIIKVEPHQTENPEEDRYHLMQSVSDFLTKAASVKPILIVLEDLHDADKGTMEMLSYVSRNLVSARLLIVGTYRDIEVDRNHPLSGALAELRRASNFNRMLLRGLNVNEVKRMMENITNETIPVGLADAVYRQTEGNPLFIQEVVRYLTEEQLLKKENGKTITDKTPLEMNIPEGLKDVIGRRLSNLSDECNKLLSVAAVIGRDFRTDVLQKVCGLSEDEVFNSIESAKRVGVVEEHTSLGAATTYRFTHAFFKTILYEENIAPRRMRLHQQVAQVLEEVYANRLQDHAGELADHFSYSTEPSDLTKAVHYGEMAARQALAVYAYGEHVRLLEHVLKVQEVLDPDDIEKRCDLLRRLSNALTISGEPRRALNTELPEAFNLAESINDTYRASRVCLYAMVALANYGTTLVADTPEFARWVERADRYAAPDTVDRAWADAFMGTMYCVRGRYEEGVKLLGRAVTLSRKLGKTNAYWMSVHMYSQYAAAPKRLEERLLLAEELALIPRTGINTTTLGTALFHMGSTFLEAGKREKAEELFNEMKNLSERSAQPMLELLVLRGDLIMATLDGRLEEAVEISQNMQSSGEEVGLSEFASAAAAYFSLTPHIHTGRFEEAYRLAQLLPTVPSMVASALCLAHMRQKEEANQILEELVVQPSLTETEDNETPAYILAMLLDAAVATNHEKAAEILLKRLAGSDVQSTCYFCMTCILRHLGAAASLMNKAEDARNYYREGLEVATNMNFRPELALTRLGIAELLLKHFPDEKAEALEHLDFVIKEFREMNMQPSLNRSLKHKDILKA